MNKTTMNKAGYIRLGSALLIAAGCASAPAPKRGSDFLNEAESARSDKLLNELAALTEEHCYRGTNTESPAVPPFELYSCILNDKQLTSCEGIQETRFIISHQSELEMMSCRDGKGWYVRGTTSIFGDFLFSWKDAVGYANIKCSCARTPAGTITPTSRDNNPVRSTPLRDAELWSAVGENIGALYVDLKSHFEKKTSP